MSARAYYRQYAAAQQDYSQADFDALSKELEREQKPSATTSLSYRDWCPASVPNVDVTDLYARGGCASNDTDADLLRKRKQYALCAILRMQARRRIELQGSSDFGHLLPVTLALEQAASCNSKIRHRKDAPTKDVLRALRRDSQAVQSELDTLQRKKIQIDAAIEDKNRRLLVRQSTILRHGLGRGLHGVCES